MQVFEFKDFQSGPHCMVFTNSYRDSHEPCTYKCVLFVLTYLVVFLHFYDYCIKLFYCSLQEREDETAIVQVRQEE